MQLTKIKNECIKTIGIVIMIIGLGMTIYTSISYFTREKIVDAGIFEIFVNLPHILYW